MTGRSRSGRRPRPDGDTGQVTALLVASMLGFLLLAGLILDGGTALAARTRALDTAQAAARVGAQQLDLTGYRTTGRLRLDPTQAIRAARAFLAAAGVPGQVTASTGAVTVTTHTSRPTQLLQIFGLRTVRATATATATPTATNALPRNRP